MAPPYALAGRVTMETRARDLESVLDWMALQELAAETRGRIHAAPLAPPGNLVDLDPVQGRRLA
jgi:hypothetical protein